MRRQPVLKHLFRVMIAIAALSFVSLILSPRNLVLILGQGEAENKSDVQATGPYEVVKDWPRPLSELPGHEKWTWGAMPAVFAQNPNRIFVGMRGEIPKLQRPASIAVPQFGPGLAFPIGSLPFRNASTGPVGSLPEGEGKITWTGKVGVDARWEHSLFVLNADGKIIEAWTQWDALIKLPHMVLINPYDPEKHVWVVDDMRNQIFEFTNDGEKLVLTLGEKDVPGDDDKHFARPTDITWLPDGTMFVSDGYVNSRVVKFDKNGKYLMSWGQAGRLPNEKRPNYFNVVHAVAVDAQRRVYVDDRSNHRIQIFDENGKYLAQWYLGDHAEIDSIVISADQYLWMCGGTTNRIYKYDLTGHMLYSWGTMGDFPGAFWGPHSFSVDQDGNLYVAEALNGRLQKFTPRKGVDPDLLVGQPVRAAWKD